MDTTGSTLSPWAADVSMSERRHHPLSIDTRADVVIVGAGIAGLTTAYMLAREKLDVVVVDDGPFGGGETERTTAHLSSALDDRFVDLERMHGREGARIAAASHAEAITTIEEIVAARGIACGFSRLDGWLFCGASHTPDILQAEMEAARRAGLSDVEMHDRVPHLTYDTGVCLRFPNQGQIHPLRYLKGLVDAFIDEGGRIHTGSHVAHVDGGEHAGVITTEGRIVHAKAVIVTTNTPINDRFAIHTKQHAYRTYVVSFAVQRGAAPAALLWDTEDPYHYVRVHPQGAPDGRDLLLVGGEDHKTGHEADAAKRWTRLYDWTLQRFPSAQPVGRWSGQIMEPTDGLAYVGRNPTGADNVFIATGDSGHGMTHGTIAGLILSDLVRGVEHPWADLYDPARKPLGAVGTYAAENIDSAMYYASYILPSKVKDEDQIQRGAGAVVRHGLRPIAVYCEESGVHSMCSAVCPHLGGLVTWNDAEKTWDCPVHGSRFDKHGHVLNGPANVDLQPIEEPSEKVVPIFSEPLKEA